MEANPAGLRTAFVGKLEEALMEPPSGSPSPSCAVLADSREIENAANFCLVSVVDFSRASLAEATIFVEATACACIAVLRRGFALPWELAVASAAAAFAPWVAFMPVCEEIRICVTALPSPCTLLVGDRFAALRA